MRVLVARGRISLFLVQGRGRRLLLHTSFRTRARIGHVRQDWPQRQGSQDFGTAQSQLAVEHESIRFIPPRPSMSQRDQFQFRCNTSTASSTNRPEGPECGSKSGTDQSCAAEAWWTLGW